MEKQLAYTIPGYINEWLKATEQAAQSLQPFVNRCSEISSVPELETEDLYDFFINPRSFFVSKLTKGETLKVGDLSLSSEKVFDLLDRPDELDKLVSDIEALKYKQHFQSNCFGQIQNLQLVEGILEVKQSWIDDVTERFSYYIETDNQFAALDLMNEILPKINELFSMCNASKLPAENKTYLETLFKGSGTGIDRIYQINMKSIVDAF